MRSFGRRWKARDFFGNFLRQNPPEPLEFAGVLNTPLSSAI
jgi:hypothetical protein